MKTRHLQEKIIEDMQNEIRAGDLIVGGEDLYFDLPALVTAVRSSPPDLRHAVLCDVMDCNGEKKRLRVLPRDGILLVRRVHAVVRT